MAPRKKPSVDLKEVRLQMVQVKALIISLGQPYARVRRIDDALEVIDSLIAKESKS